MSRRSISGKRAIVTGASSGIGEAIVRELAGAGANVIVTARRAERLEGLAASLQNSPGKIIVVAGDITAPQLRNRLLHTAEEELGGLDILINNAGIGAFGPFAEADEARLRKLMEVNFFAPLELTRSALPLLKQGDQPMIVNVGSVLGHFAVPDKSEYVASKFALHGFNDALREELTADGIDVLLVSPSTTDSEFFDNVIDRPAEIAAPHVSRLKMSPQAVARRTVQAMIRGRREIILSMSGKLAVWADRLCPWLTSWILSRR